MTTVLEAYDWIRFADQYGEKLEGALADLESRPQRVREKAWMRAGVELLEEERERAFPICERMRMLPEMTQAREEHAAQQVGPWVDALEKLLAGITFHFGSRAPVIEALFPHQKLIVLRRGNLDEVRTFANELERRLKSSYVERIFGQEEYAFARVVVEQVRAAYAAIGASIEGAPLSDEERTSLTEEAIAIARALETAIAQARLLAEAALVPFEGAFVDAGLNAKIKKRATKVSESDVPSAVVEVAEEEAPLPEPESEVVPEPEALPDPEPDPEPAAAPVKAKKKRSKKSAEASSEA
jgi:hypothetical protein